MASDDQTTPAAPRKHRLRIWLFCLFAVVIAVLAAGSWLLKSESGAQFAFGLVDKLSGGMAVSYTHLTLPTKA